MPSERLASLHIMGSNWENPSNSSAQYCWDVWGVSESFFVWFPWCRQAPASRCRISMRDFGGRGFKLHAPSYYSGWFSSSDSRQRNSLFKGLDSLGVMGEELRATLEPLNTIVLWFTGGFRGALTWAPIMPTAIHTSDRCCISIQSRQSVSRYLKRKPKAKKSIWNKRNFIWLNHGPILYI